jgi:murein L,D-transpeptidase YafK
MPFNPKQVGVRLETKPRSTSKKNMLNMKQSNFLDWKKGFKKNEMRLQFYRINKPSFAFLHL